MREFFRGWRTKVGLVTLVMALTFMVGWVRSSVAIDFFCFRIFPNTFEILSTPEGIGLQRYQYVLATGPKPGIPWVSPAEAKTMYRQAGPLTTFGCVYNHKLGDEQKWGFFIRYYTITIPLTALSAFLLLSEPRKSNQKKTDQPIPDESGGAA